VSGESKEVIRLGTGLIATLVALILGLLVATAKSSFDAKEAEVKQISARIVQVDRTLRQFGPETVGARRILRALVAARAERPWIEDTRAGREGDLGRAKRIDEFVDALLALQPTNERQQWLKSQALELSAGAVNLRWLFAQDVESAHRTMTASAVAFRGAMSPRLVKITPSQKTSTTSRGRETALSTSWANSQRRFTAPALSSSAWPFSHC